MKRVHAGIALVLGLAVSGTAGASGAFTGRVGLTGGTYEFDAEATSTGCPTCFPAGTVFFTAEDADNTYGLLLGTGLTAGRFFVDVGAEVSTYSENSDFYRSDGLLTLGAFIGDRWTVFGGFRNATFGDGVFSETNGNTETGPFLGGGVSFRAGKRLSMGVSAAYNKITLSDDSGTFEDTDLDGFSLKLQMSFLGTPHAIFLRGQRFDGEENVSEFSYIYEYSETYFNLGYQATFDFTSW
jgi:hypothetical protein